ncbi:RNA-directed DNA polymerase, eukaryota [Tanacetum coccineum]
MATEPNDVRRTILRHLREQLEADVALANNLLDVLTRYLKQMCSRGPEMLGVQSLSAHHLISYVCSSFRRDPRGGIEHQQMMELQSLLETVSLSNSKDRWIFDLTGDGVFSVKALRNFIDDKILLSHPEATNWVKNIPIKVNIFNWRARRDCLPTRLNLAYRGVVLESIICPVCKHAVEDIKHILFRCDLARSVLRRVCRWWGLDQQDWSSFLDWHNWFSSTRLPLANKELLEGVFYTAW